MMHGAVRTRRAPRRTRSLDLSRKTSLVSRFWTHGAGVTLRRLSLRGAFLASRYGGVVLSALAVARIGRADAEGTAWLGPWELVGGGLLTAYLLARLLRRLRRLDLGADAVPARRALLEDLDLAGLSVVTTWVALTAAGGPGSPVFPVLYLVLAALVAFHAPVVAIFAVALSLSIHLFLAWSHGWLFEQGAQVVATGVFVAAFSAFYHLALAAIARRARAKADAAVTAHLEELHRRAREYRLIVSDSSPNPGEDAEGQERWLTAAVGEVEAAVRANLEVAEAALGTRTVAVYLLSPDERTLRLRECLSASPRISREPLAAGEGLPGAVVRRRAPVRLAGDFRGAVYDRSGRAPGAFLGIPLVDHTVGGDEGYLRGVLLADRAEVRAFSDADEQLLTAVGREILRSIQGERVLGYIRKEKDEKARFFRAIEALNLLSKPGEICERVADLAGELATLDFAAVTLAEAEPETGKVRHRIVEAFGPGAERLKGSCFEDNAGLVANVVRLGSALPGRDFHEMERTVVFGEGLQLKGLSTLKVLPLSVGEETVGTLVCGAAARAALSADSVRMLGVLAIQAAGAIARARLFETTERLATTDGLTGLTNHRRFQELFDAALASSRRYSRPLAVLLTDVDHFKSVNDTYGHPIGDKVLKGVAAILRSQARDTDTCARYGGEEFAVVLPETDAEGARVIAERIRAAVEAHTFQTELGPLKITISVGISACPEHGQEKQTLIDRCDQALYAAKRSGRNRVVSAEEAR